MTSAFTFIQIFYWLSLATWFGGILFIMIAAPIIFRVIGESDPTLPTVLSVNLEGQHGTLLAGSIVAELLSAMVRIQLLCGGVLALTLISQWVILYQVQFSLLVVRTSLYLVAVVMLVYDWRIVSPKIFKYRQDYIDHADEPELANPAKDEFDRYHRESVSILMFQCAMLLGLVLFSAGISTARSYTLGQ